MQTKKLLSLYEKNMDILNALKEEREFLTKKAQLSYLTRPERAYYNFMGRLMEMVEAVLEELES